MQLETSKILESKQKTNEQQNDIIWIRYIPLPPEQQEAYEVAIRTLAKLLIDILEEEEEERSQLDVLPKGGSGSRIRSGHDQVSTVKESLAT